MFSDDHNIKDYYNRTFKQVIEKLVDDYIYNKIVAAYEVNNQSIKGTFK